MTTLSAENTSSIATLVKDAKTLYESLHDASSTSANAITTVAPGRVNLIGEHTDYTGGYVLPLAIDYSTVVYGTGELVDGEETTVQLTSTKNPDERKEFTLTRNSTPPKDSNHTDWTLYVKGVVAMYLPDLPLHQSFNLVLAIAGNVPLGGGLSSSASLEVAVARMLEQVLANHAYSSCQKDDDSFSPSKQRALRCQAAENNWCHSPCGIMDQYISSAASQGTLLLIDCRSLEFERVQMAPQQQPVLVVTNSHVSHSIGGGEYPKRVEQCKTATAALQKQNSNIQSLRDATLENVENAKESMDDTTSYKRAKHVVTENARVLRAKTCLESGDWKQLGMLLNESHTSMRDDYEVSCKEIDILVDLAQSFSGVYGSRLTGGGFGGCTVTLVEKSRVTSLMEHLKKEYKSKTGKDCTCFETTPSEGARVLDAESML